MRIPIHVKTRLDWMRTQWFRWTPRVFVVESTNRCNLNCRMCPAHGVGSTINSRPVGCMDTELHQSIITQLSQSVSHGVVVAHGAGEPLLHPEFLTLLETIRRTGNLDIAFLTNGVLMSQEMAKQILDIGIRDIGFSINGLTRDTYRTVCGIDAWSTINANIRSFIELMNTHHQSSGLSRPRVRLQIIAGNDTPTRMEQFVAEWLHLVDEIVIQAERDPTGREFAKWHETTRHMRRLPSCAPCHRLAQPLTVNWQGKVHLCCEDWRGDIILGDFTSQSYPAILKSLRAYLVKHRTFQKNRIAICRNCVAPLERSVTIQQENDRTIMTTPLWRKIK